MVFSSYNKEISHKNFMKTKPTLSDIIVELHVPDFNITKDFYGKLGFQTVWEYPPHKQSGYLVMRRGNSILAFFCGNNQVYQHAYFKNFPPQTPRGYAVEIRLNITDQKIETYYQHVIKSCGAKVIVEPLTLQPWGSKDFRIIDPFGFYICIREPWNILYP
jgi:lactoylglutathione lyase